ncbi:hypothetical protein GCM10009745_38410 [Kribbella yunnanensis]|uniref:PPE domain-containing protein n=1 Tax=Kribbella yunnanensis TaxID=190194 RepID=A0ABN2HKL9_9ACTN
MMVEANSYARSAEINTSSPAQMVFVAQGFVDVLTGEVTKTVPAVRTDLTLWTDAATVLDRVGSNFWGSTMTLMGPWAKQAESAVYRTAAERSTKSLHDSADAITGSRAGGPSQAGGNLDSAFGVIEGNINTVKTSATQVLQDAKNHQMAMDNGPVLADVTAVENQLRANLVRVGEQMDQLALQYVAFGDQVKAVGSSVRWQGPHSDVSGGAPPGSPGAPSNSPGGPAGAPTGEAPAGGETPGGEDAGGAPGEAPGEAGGGPEGSAPGGDDTGLAGTPTLPAPPPVTPLRPLPPLDLTPVPPLTPLAPIGSVGGSSGTSAGGGRGGGVGGGGLGGLGGSKAGPLKPLDGLGQQQIPSVAKTTGTEGAPSAGRAPTMPGGLTTGGTSGATGGGGMPPPMMPPMAGGAGGGGKAGKPGTGAVRPNGRERSRATGPTPGVPDRLRGKARNKGAFPVAVTRSSGRRDTDPVDGLQILDEELWTVEPTGTTAEQPKPRPGV